MDLQILRRRSKEPNPNAILIVKEFKSVSRCSRSVHRSSKSIQSEIASYLAVFYCHTRSPQCECKPAIAVERPVLSTGRWSGRDSFKMALHLWANSNLPDKVLLVRWLFWYQNLFIFLFYIHPFFSAPFFLLFILIKLCSWPFWMKIFFWILWKPQVPKPTCKLFTYFSANLELWSNCWNFKFLDGNLHLAFLTVCVRSHCVFRKWTFF